MTAIGYEIKIFSKSSVADQLNYLYMTKKVIIYLGRRLCKTVN